MKLKELLAKNQITPYRLAKDAGLNPSQIYRILNGQQPTLPTQRKLATALGVTLDELAGDDDIEKKGA